MTRLLAGVSALVLAGLLTAADKDDKPAAPTGTWVREANGVELTFEFAKDKLTLSVLAGDNGAVLTCKSSTGKDGVVKMTVTKVEEKGNFPPKPKEGTEYTFKWKASGDKATLSDLTGEGVEDANRSVVEGEYSKKK